MQVGRVAAVPSGQGTADSAAATSPGSGSRSGKWHAAWWAALLKGRSGGSAVAHSSWARGQRVRNRQPLGGAIAEGSSPTTPWCSLARSAAGSATGTVR